MNVHEVYQRRGTALPFLVLLGAVAALAGAGGTLASEVFNEYSDEVAGALGLTAVALGVAGGALLIRDASSET